MPEIKHVVVATRNPTPGHRNDVGSAEEGYFFVSDGVLTMCDVKGSPLRDDHAGNRITHRLLDGENERVIASRFVLSRWRAANGGDDMAGFNAPIHYATPYGGY